MEKDRREEDPLLLTRLILFPSLSFFPSGFFFSPWRLADSPPERVLSPFLSPFCRPIKIGRKKTGRRIAPCNFDLFLCPTEEIKMASFAFLPVARCRLSISRASSPLLRLGDCRGGQNGRVAINGGPSITTDCHAMSSRNCTGDMGQQTTAADKAILPGKW